MDRTEYLINAQANLSADPGDFIYVKWNSVANEWHLSHFPPPGEGITKLVVDFNDGEDAVAFAVTDNTTRHMLTYPNAAYTGDQFTLLTLPIENIATTFGSSSPTSLNTDTRRYKITYVDPAPTDTTLFWNFFNVIADDDRTLELATSPVTSESLTNGSYVYIRWNTADGHWRLDPDVPVAPNRYLSIGVMSGSVVLKAITVGGTTDEHLFYHSVNYTGFETTTSILLHNFGTGGPTLDTDPTKRYKLEFVAPTVGEEDNFWSFFTITEDVPVCYHGDSWVEVRKKVKDVVPGDLVRSADGWVEVKDNIKSWGGNEYLVIDPGRWGCQDPLYMIRGHPVLIDGVERNVEDLENIRIASKDPKECVYCIATDERIFIRVNGMLVCTWKYEEWKNTDLAKKICWESSKK